VIKIEGSVMSKNIVLTSVNERGIAEVILNRPERNNAYNGDMIIELIKSFESLYKNDSVRIVLIKGNGKHFQAGADLQWLKEIGKLSQKENIEVSRKTASAIQGLTKFPKPTIALIHGGCFGGGTGIAAAADIVIASEDAIFSISEARWGVMAGIIIPHLNASIGF
jgi:methylglutaconyl-CoA hydratase